MTKEEFIKKALADVEHKHHADEMDHRKPMTTKTTTSQPKLIEFSQDQTMQIQILQAANSSLMRELRRVESLRDDLVNDCKYVIGSLSHKDHGDLIARLKSGISKAQGKTEGENK